VFHFNKKHLEDQTIPMWVVKTHGETFYVNHVNCELPWSTKETPDNSHTKGSIKVKDCLLTINDDNEATISRLTIYDKIRLRNQKLGITRIIWRNYTFAPLLKEEKVKHGPFKTMYGGCGSQFTVCDILDKHDMMMLSLKYPGQFRVLAPNEEYYKAFDDKKLWKKLQQEEDDY
jgi:hypothetical protein